MLPFFYERLVFSGGASPSPTNDVGLRPMMLRFAQTDTLSPPSFCRGAPWCSRFFNERFGFFGRSKPLPYGKVERANHGAKRSYPCAEVFRSTHPPQAVPLPSQGKALSLPQFPANALQSPRFCAILIIERR